MNGCPNKKCKWNRLKIIDSTGKTLMISGHDYAYPIFAWDEKGWLLLAWRPQFTKREPEYRGYHVDYCPFCGSKLTAPEVDDAD